MYILYCIVWWWCFSFHLILVIFFALAYFLCLLIAVNVSFIPNVRTPFVSYASLLHWLRAATSKYYMRWASLSRCWLTVVIFQTGILQYGKSRHSTIYTEKDITMKQKRARETALGKHKLPRDLQEFVGLFFLSNNNNNSKKCRYYFWILMYNIQISHTHTHTYTYIFALLCSCTFVYLRDTVRLNHKCLFSRHLCLDALDRTVLFYFFFV